MANPKKRGSNYTESEKQLLLSLIEDYSYIINNKETGSQFLRDKHEAWLHIETRYNELATTGRRTYVQLRRLYDNLKAKARKGFAMIENNLGQDEPKQKEGNTQEVTIEVKESDDDKENCETSMAASDTEASASGSNNQIKNNFTVNVSSNHVEKIASLKEELYVQKLKNAKLERVLLIAENSRRETLLKMKLQLLKLKINKQFVRNNNKHLSTISLE